MTDLQPFPMFIRERPGFVITTDSRRFDLDAIHRFLSEDSYWAPGVSRESVERSIRYSLAFGLLARADGQIRQAGFGRVISDYTTYAYLADVFVLPEYRGRGLGKWLVESVLAHPELQTLRRWALYTRDAHGLYRSFGFENEDDPRRYMSYRPRRILADPA